MKPILFLSLFLTISLTVFSQNTLQKKDVPKAVLDAYFSQTSTGTSDSIWSKENITVYKVNYKDNSDGTAYEAQYLSDGRWIKTISQIELSALPAGVVAKANAMYPKAKTGKAHIELNNDGKFYALDIMQDKSEMTIYFTMSGKFVK